MWLNQKIYMLSWLIIPLLGLVFATSFLVGLNKNPSWQVNALTTSKTTPLVFDKFDWQNTGLVTLWFDDAWLSQYLAAQPVMEKYGYVGSLAVPTRLIGYDAYMNWAQIKFLQYKGWEINSHTRTHDCNTFNLNSSEVEHELLGSKQDLESQGLFAENFVTPCGAETKDILAVAKKYYLSVRGSGAGLNKLPVQDPYHLTAYPIQLTTSVEEVRQWIAEAAQTRTWLILMFHQIDDSKIEYTTSPKTFESMIKEVKDSGLPVVLPTQVLHLQTNSSTNQ